MIIKDAINTPGPKVPDVLQPHILQQSCCQLTLVEILAFQLAIQALGEYIHTHPLQPVARCVLVYTDQLELTIQQHGLEAGQYLPLSVIWMNITRSRSYQPEVLMEVLLEELCHNLFQINNEYLVKIKVFDILRDHIQTKLHQRYPTMFDEHDQPKLDPDFADDFAELST